MNIQTTYQTLLQQISETYTTGQTKAIQATNTTLLETYWQIGAHIVEFEQGGNTKAEYGTALLERLSKDLTLSHGKGFSRSSLNYMRLLYARFPICETLSHKLSWSHYCELVKIDHDLERQFYEKQCALENWSIRELKRQKASALFLRIAASQNREDILKLALKGNIVAKPSDLLRDPYVFEFLKIPEPYHLSKHGDIGQMNMYLGYFANEENGEGDNPPIGIVFTREKDDLLVKYATYGMNSQLFVSKYQLYLPNEEEMRSRLEAAFRK